MCIYICTYIYVDIVPAFSVACCRIAYDGLIRGQISGMPGGVDCRGVGLEVLGNQSSALKDALPKSLKGSRPLSAEVCSFGSVARGKACLLLTGVV